MRKPNYRFERAERDRLKQAKKEEKLRRHRERAVPQQSGPVNEDDSPRGTDEVA